jgi:hypothetical protein
MRSAAVIALVVAAGAIAAVVLTRGQEPDRGRTGSLTMVGDSLNVGIEPYLERELPGWRITTDDVVGRGSDDGIAALASLGDSLAPVVVVSLGTNDPQDDVDGFRADVRDLLARAGPDRCVIWATIWRNGANDAFNAVLREEADANGSLRLVDWHEMLAANLSWLSDDVHATPEGYEARAAAVADQARDCLPSEPA